MEQSEQISLDKVAMWLGELQINLKLAQEQINRLTEENKQLNQNLADIKLKG